MLVTVFVYRQMSWEDFVHATLGAVRTTAMVLLIIGTAAAFSWLMAFLKVPAALIAWMNAISDNPLVMLLLLNVLMLLLGTFMDMGPTIIICTPIFLPVAQAYGIDPVHFGVIMILNFGIGLNTPPVGAVQFVACAVGKITVWEAMRSIWPFYGGGARGARAGHLRPGDLAVAAERLQIGARHDRHRDRPAASSASRSSPSASSRRLRAQVARRRDRARPETADRKPADRDLRRQPHRHPRGDRHAGGRRAGRIAAGRRRLRARAPGLDVRRAQPEIGSKVSQALNVLEVRMGIEIESAGLAAMRRNAAQEARIQEAFFEFERLLNLGEPTGKADFAFHRAIASATNNPFYVEMLDALGDRTIPCDVTSPWYSSSVLSTQYLTGLQREHLVILKAISAGDAEAARDAMRAHLIASQERYRKRLTSQQAEYLAASSRVRTT